MDAAMIEEILNPKFERVVVPGDAEVLIPANMGPAIYIMREKNQMLKAGRSVLMCEAEAMRFVAQDTCVPVPEVIAAYTQGGNGYIVMSKVEGERLGAVWRQFDSAQKMKVIDQLRTHVQQLASLSSDFYGALWREPSREVFFIHLPCKRETISYGPCYSRWEYNEGLITALLNSRPHYRLHGDDEALVAQGRLQTCESIVFSHGDLHPGNILVDPHTARVTDILDWETAGFSIPGREYLEARLRSQDDGWTSAVDQIIDASGRAHFDLLLRLDNALKRHTRI